MCCVSRIYISQHFLRTKERAKEIATELLHLYLEWSDSSKKSSEMDIQQNTNSIVVKDKEAESMLVINSGRVLKQEPSDRDSVETCHNVYHSLFEVKQEMCENRLEIEHITHSHMDKKLFPAEPGLSLEKSTFIKPASLTINEGNKAHPVKTEQYEPIDKCQQLFEIEIDAVPFNSSHYNYDTREERCISTPSNVCLEPTCDAVTKPEIEVLEQEEPLAVTQTTIQLFYSQTTSQHYLPDSESGNSTHIDTTIHNTKTHNVKNLYVCKLCPYKCSRKIDLKKHTRTHTGHKRFSCELCSYKCAQKSSLVAHMRTHSGEKPYSCKLCDYKCAVASSLTTHMRMHTGHKPFHCDLCPYKSTCKSSLGSHMRTHTGDKPFQCNVCQNKFTNKGHLQDHMKIHTGEKPFNCELCSYKCARKSTLMTHMRTHTGEKPFVCALCHTQFKQSSHLVGHMKTHSGEKPFCCTHCDFKCSKLSSLNRHLRTHTGERPFSCSVCDYKSAGGGNLARHMKTHTK